jgi:integrase
MGKRGNGEGGISRRKDGLYMARYTVQTPTGSKRKTLYGKTRREVDEKLTKAKADRDGGLVFDADNLKLGEYLARWLADSVRDTVRPTTFERYEQIVRLHIRPVLGKVKLKNLTSAHVRGLYREKLDSGLSPRTVQYVHVTLHKALKQAIADGLIPRNATEAVKPPQVRREEMRPLTAEQARILFDAAKGDRLEALYVLAVTTGLRQGELLGLKWDDIDLEGGTLQVRLTLTTAKGAPVLSAPKTKGSRRTVRLSQMALEALTSHLERQLGEDGSGRRSVAREWPHIRVGRGRAAGPPLYYHAPLQAPAQAGGATADTLPRPPAYVRHAATHPQREPEDSVRDARARLYSHHPRHLLPCAPQHAGERRQSDGRHAFLARWCSNWCKEARRECRASFLCFDFSFVLQVI